MRTYTIILFLTLYSIANTLKAQQFTEYELKSAYLFNFAKFIDFPENTFSSARDPFLIGVIGNEAFLDVLQTVIKGKTINGRNIIAINITQTEDIQNCQIVYFSKTTRSQTLMFLEFLNGKPVVSVGDNIEDFCQSGGIINFTQQNSVKRFEINPNAAQRAKLNISSKLLALARIVTDVEVKF
ncbi:MAG TPA: YfiR family protein [Bacteroidales bacterium]|nr:YfiR family protein [Bacteroidales bacterium]